MRRFQKQLNSFRVVMGPPCSLYFLSNQSTNSLARLDFPIDSATLFYDNSLCSNVHSASIESKALNIFLNNFDESFSVEKLRGMG